MAKRHTDREYENELKELRERLLLMAGRVEEMITKSIKALIDRDAILARKTIEADRRVNRDEMEIDEMCLVVLAKRQPMASDLRFITLSLKMVVDLERIGDLAVNICERAIDLAPQPPLRPYTDIPQMAQLVRGMLHDAVDSFVDRDADKAQSVIDRDDLVDQHYLHTFQELLEVMQKNAGGVHRGLQLQSVAKWLERMADHITNLAEQVIFMVKGKDIRHAGKLDVRSG
jgi:phosphate transport system protein